MTLKNSFKFKILHFKNIVSKEFSGNKKVPKLTRLSVAVDIDEQSKLLQRCVLID